MSNGYIKKFRTEKSKELKRKHTSAFLILDTVAENAKRKVDEGHSLLEISEAIITAEECGLTPQRFETGLKYLENNKYIEVLHRGRKDKKSKLDARIKPESTQSSILIKTRINGTVVKLIDLTIYDINAEVTPNHIPNQTRINSDETPNKEEVKKEEVKKKNKKITSYSLIAHELFTFFIESLKKHLPEVTKYPKEEEIKYFDSLLKDHKAETIKQVIEFAHTDDFWSDKTHTPRNLVMGSKKNPDRFGQLSTRMKNNQRSKHEDSKQSPTDSDLSKPRRVNELIV